MTTWLYYVQLIQVPYAYSKQPRWSNYANPHIGDFDVHAVITLLTPTVLSSNFRIHQYVTNHDWFYATQTCTSFPDWKNIRKKC